MQAGVTENLEAVSKARRVLEKKHLLQLKELSTR